MRIFQHSQGFLIAFGFDMIMRKPAPKRICWNDPNDGGWEMSPGNLAGWNDFAFSVNPGFIHESDGRIIAYQPGLCLEMALCGSPLVWRFTLLRSDARVPQAA